MVPTGTAGALVRITFHEVFIDSIAADTMQASRHGMCISKEANGSYSIYHSCFHDTIDPTCQRIPITGRRLN